MAFTDTKECVINKGTEIVARYMLGGVPQGCSSSVLMMVIVTILVGWQVEKLNLGFIFPSEGQSTQWWDMELQASPGLAYADDLFAATGGGRSWENRLTAEEVISRMTTICEHLMGALRALCLPVGHLKTVLTGFFFDEEGNKFVPEVEMAVFSEVGETSIRFKPIEEIVPHLGVIHHTAGMVGHQMHVMQVEQEAKMIPLIHDPDLHPKMLLDMWFISVMGKWKYVASKVDAPDTDITAAEKMSRSVVRRIMKIHNLPVPCMYARHEDFGLGLPDIAEFKKLAAMHAVCSFAFSQDRQVEAFFWTYLQMTRMINGIQAAHEPNDFSFFNWNVEGLAAKQIQKMPWQNDLIEVLLVCKERDLEFQLTRMAKTLLRKEWCMIGGAGALDAVKGHGEVTLVSEAVGITRKWRLKKVAMELQILGSAGALARASRPDKTLSNFWKKTGKVTLSEWSFQIRATYRMLVSPAKKHQWDNSVSAACSLCGHSQANQKHILSCCSYMSSRQYAWRHNQVLQCVKRAIAKRWQIISEEVDATKRWIPRGLAIESRATKPDLTLLSEVAGQDILIRIVDVAVAYDEDENMERAENEKIRKYEGLRKAIEERAVREKWQRKVQVEVVPVVVYRHSGGNSKELGTVDGEVTHTQGRGCNSGKGSKLRSHKDVQVGVG